MSKELDDAYFRSTPCTHHEPLLGKLVDCVDLLEERIKGLLGAKVYVGETNTLPAGSEATVSASKHGYDTMLEFGIPRGKDGSDAEATDVRIAGKSITADGVADMPLASKESYGAMKVGSNGLYVLNGVVSVNTAAISEINSRRVGTVLAIPQLDYAVKAAMCDGKGAMWTDAEKLAARERLGIGGNIEVTTLTFEEPVNNATLTFQTPKPYSTVIVQFYVPKTPEDTNNRACPMYLNVSKQDGSDEKAMYTWIDIPNISNSQLNFVGLLSNNNGLWTWQVKGPIANDYYANNAWIIQLPSYRSPADFIVKERPYVKSIDIGWVSSAFPAGTNITAYGVL